MPLLNGDGLLRCGLTGALCLLVVFAACGQAHGQQPGDPAYYPTDPTYRDLDRIPPLATPSSDVIHPTPGNLLADDEVDHVIRTSGGELRDAAPALQAYARRLRAAEPVVTIGTAEGSRRESIGKVEAIASAEAGFYLLDGRYNEVRHYDAQGVLLRAFEGSEHGFQAPNDLEWAGDGRLVVSERGGPSRTFEVEGDSLTRQFTASARGIMGDFCVMNETTAGGAMLFAHGVRMPSSIEEMSRQRAVRVFSMEDGAERTAFGALYISRIPFVRTSLSTGFVACSDETQLLAAAFHALPVLSGYSPDGTLIWQTKIARFKPTRWTETMSAEGQASLASNPVPQSQGGESDLIATLTAAPGGHFIAQVARRNERSLRARDQYAELHTYLIDAATGEGVHVSDRLPLIRAATAHRIYASTNDPFPQVNVYQLPATD